MIKRILSFIVLILIIISIALSLGGCEKKIGRVDDIPAVRSQADIDSEDVHYFDSEAVALADSADTASLRSEALRAYNMVNEQREKAGLGTLDWDLNLEQTSNVRAMECEKSFSHTRPNKMPWYTVNSEIMGGENLAFGYNDASSVLRGWMDSPTHRENILYPTFTKISISVYRADDDVYYWAQEFGY